MNYGYESLGEPLSLTLAPEDEKDRYCIQLYHQIIENVVLSNKDVLEVGSGRGGGLSYIQRYFKPVRTIGIDYSEKAVELCLRKYQVPFLTFMKGDAESLPFGNDEMDVIFNVESSHCYGNIQAFFHEVYRVLRSGGYFLYADFRDKQSVERWVEGLKDSGLRLIRQRDITSNVLAALEADNQRKMRLIQEFVPKLLMNSFLDFAGMKEGIIYELFKKRDLLYFSFILQKS